MTTAAEFLSRVLPEVRDGESLFVTSFTTSGAVAQRAVHSQEDLLATSRAAYNNQRNCYYAPAVFTGSDHRLGDNMARKRALHVDVDFGPTKPYSNLSHILRDMQRFLAAANYPSPTSLVKTGNGLHLYWICAEDLPPAKWAALSLGLKQLCKQHEFHADHQCTADRSRILRMPGTMNYKQDPPRECAILFLAPQDIPLTTLEAATPTVTGPALSLIQGGKLDDDLVGDIGGEPSYFAELKSRCAVVRHTLETGGKDDSEPLWKSLLHLAAHCEDGVDWIDKLGERHPKYSQASTRDKFAQRLEQKALSVGPTTCDTFAGMCPDICGPCEFRSGIKTPWVLGRKGDEDVTTPLPKRYFQNWLGLWQRSSQEGDDPKMVLPYVLSKLALHTDPAKGLVVSFTARRGKNNTYHVEVPYEAVGTPAKLVATLARAGLAVGPRLRERLEQFLQDYIHHMQLGDTVSTTTNEFGWDRTVDDDLRFIAGDWSFGKSRLGAIDPKNKQERLCTDDDELSSQYIPKGAIGPWSAAVKFINHQGEPSLNMLVATAFAAPLITFTGVSGLSMSFTSRKSGTGKSSAMQVAQAVWGHPIKGVNALNDTPNAVMHKLGKLRNYPLYWDELRMKGEIDKYVQLTFQLSQGRGKQRLSRDIQTRVVQTWETLLVSASNESLVDHIKNIIPDSDAGLLRIMEFNVPRIKSANVGTMLQMFQALKGNYGRAGLAYGEYLAGNAEKIQTMVQQTMTQFAAASRATHDERFWIAGATTLLAGMAIANKLGLTAFDIPRLTQYLLDWFIAHRPSVTSTAPNKGSDFTVLSRYLDTFAAHTVTVSKMQQVGSRTAAADFSIFAMPDRHPIHCAFSANGLLVRKQDFHTWLYENGYMPSDFHRSMLEAGASQGMYQLGMGVAGASTGMTMCYRIDKGSEIGGYFYP